MKQLWMVAIAAAGLTTVGWTQSLINLNPGRSLPKTPVVQYLFPQQVHMKAGQATPVALHFRVTDGMHINSHTPHDSFLIPTTFSLPTGSKVRLESVNFPQGTDITLPADPKTRLNVYTGDFIVNARIVSPAGDHLVQGKLHFQACNESQCMPPETITAAIDVIAK